MKNPIKKWFIVLNPKRVDELEPEKVRSGALGPCIGPFDSKEEVEKFEQEEFRRKN